MGSALRLTGLPSGARKWKFILPGRIKPAKCELAVVFLDGSLFSLLDGVNVLLRGVLGQDCAGLRLVAFLLHGVFLRETSPRARCFASVRVILFKLGGLVVNTLGFVVEHSGKMRQEDQEFELSLKNLVALRIFLKGGYGSLQRPCTEIFFGVC